MILFGSPITDPLVLSTHNAEYTANNEHAVEAKT